jgi:uncharacterized protein (DUF1330 family)
MSDDPFSRVPRRRPASLIDLAETKTPEATHAFVAQATRIAETTGGRVAMANEAIAPMIVPDEANPESDSAIRALVVSDYPTRDAAKSALDQRSDGSGEFDREDIRTYVARPVDRFESWFGRNLPHTLGRLFRQPVPKIENAEAREAVIEGALSLGEQPDQERWRRLVQRAGDRPIWMLNFLDYRKTAAYAEDAGHAAPSAPISGAHAYRNYGQGMIRSLAAVGGRVGWSGLTLGQVAGRDDGKWHQVAIAVYPSAAAMMTMLALPRYRAAHVHRDAALARTRLLATQPSETRKRS